MKASECDRQPAVVAHWEEVTAIVLVQASLCYVGDPISKQTSPRKNQPNLKNPFPEDCSNNKRQTKPKERLPHCSQVTDLVRLLAAWLSSVLSEDKSQDRGGPGGGGGRGGVIVDVLHSGCGMEMNL